MDYFIVKQDPDLKFIANITGWKKELGEASVTTKVVYVEQEYFKEYPDFYERPNLLMAKKFKKVLGLYQSEIEFQTVVLVDKKEENQVSYDLIKVPIADCLSDESQFKYNELTTLVLDLDKIRNYRIFQIKGGGNQLIVRLDVAESLLRRGAYGIAFEKVRISEKERV